MDLGYDWLLSWDYIYSLWLLVQLSGFRCVFVSHFVLLVTNKGLWL